MKVSGFTFIKNASKLYIPAKESILSVLPLVDEFVIAVGDNDADDNTMEIIESINSPKIKVIHTVWNADEYPKNTIYAQQTDIAMQACTGDWLIYIQGDEAIHEEDYAEIKKAMEDNVDNEKVDGFLFKYNHFWGDYNHVHRNHKWYPLEIRIVRKNNKIHSWKDAQSFRKFEEFDYSFNDYMKKEGSTKLNIIELEAYVYHYGHVRPPRSMSKKNISANKTFRGKESSIEEVSKDHDNIFDYGPLNRIPEFKGTHPAIMKDWIAKFNWKDDLQYSGRQKKGRKLLNHEKTKYRAISWVEQNLMKGNLIGGFKNYIKIKNK
ncbi:MAG: glycosyltransferase [Ichthyobacteriaceae bacterium]|nr:glycosyltransferase [Ichthyobacteriaceae bacterium]